MTLVRARVAARFAVAAACAALACAGETDFVRSENGEISVMRAVAPAPASAGSPDQSVMAVYATIANVGSADDTLASVETSSARTATIHTTMDHGGGMQMMMPAEHLVIPAASAVRLAPGGTHIMLEGLGRPFAAGDSLPLTLVFRRGGRATIAARIVAYDQLQRVLDP